MENIAIYWWSFNPPTLWHIQVVKWVLEHTDIKKIIVAPSWDRLDKSHNIEHNNRKKLIEIFIKVLKESWVNVDLDLYFFEWKNNGITTTLQEEKYFKQKLWLEPTFIYWSDVVTHMHNWVWNDNKYIEKKLKKIFINRPGYEFKPQNYSLDNYILLDIPELIQVSSSVAREMIKNKQSVADILNPEIVKEIINNNLYTK